jgi:adenylate cyclase
MVTDAPKVHRRLSAILAVDVVGFSSLMGSDEEGTLARIKSLRSEVISPKVAEHAGRVFKTTGDGVLVEFASPVEAVRCAVHIQEALALASPGSMTPLQLRIGINLGDVIVEKDGDVYGDGVNIAVRLEQLADPGGVCISGKVLDEVRNRLPYSFEDRGEQHVKNIEQPIKVHVLANGPYSGASTRLRLAPALPDKPSIAVLPFDNMSGDLEQEFFADGIADDIITGLSRLRWLFVIARHSTFTFKGKATDVRQVARALGVRYVLEGSVRKAGNRVRIAAQLIDAGEGRHIWAERYDRQLDDLFAVQDEITENVIASIEPQLYAEEGFRAATKPPESIDAWGLTVRAQILLGRIEQQSNHEAQGLAQEALRIDGRYARAHAVLGWAIMWAGFCYWEPDEEAAYYRAMTHAGDAIALDPSDPWARMTLGNVLSTTGNQEAALTELRKALALNPSSALAHTMYGWALIRAGHFDEAIEATGKALRLSPADTFSGMSTNVHGLALLASRRFVEALPFFREAVSAVPVAGHLGTLASCLGNLGMIEEAKAALARRNALVPGLTLERQRARLGRFAHGEVFLEGLRRAGAPER